MPGIAWDLLPMDRTAPTTGTASAASTGSPTPPSTPRSAARTTARSAASRRRSRAASERPACKRQHQQLPLLEPRHGHRADRRAGERYGVRNIKIADEMFVLNRRHVLGICDLHHRARLRPQHLGLHPRRHDQGRHARPAQEGRLQLAGLRHRGRRRPRPRRRGKGASTRTRSSASSSSVRERRHQRHRQLHLRPARGRPARRCRRRSTWPWS